MVQNVAYKDYLRTFEKYFVHDVQIFKNEACRKKVGSKQFSPEKIPPHMARHCFIFA